MKKPSIFIVFSIALLCTTHNSYAESLFSTFFWWPGTKEEVISHEQEVVPGTEISLHGLRGTVVIKTWNKNKILVEATKVGTVDELKLNKIDAVYSKKEISIKTVQLKPDRFCDVNYTLVVPSNAILKDIYTEKGDINIENVSTPAKIHAQEGNLNLNNVSGSLQATTKFGNIHIQTKKIQPMSKVFALAERGSIKLEVPSDTDALFCAKTNKGTITSDCPITLEPRTLKISQATLSSFKRDIRGSLGHGGTATINVHTNRGNVRVVEYS